MNTATKDGAVLFVDDDLNDVFFMHLGFKAADLPQALHIVVDGQQAIDYLAGNGPFADRAQHPLPALVLLDLHMPGLSGFEVLNWLRQQPQFQSLPVVIFTASDRTADQQQARQLGANDYIIKPIDLVAGLPELLKELARRWLCQ